MRANWPEQQLSELSLQKKERWSHQDQLCRSLLARACECSEDGTLHEKHMDVRGD